MKERIPRKLILKLVGLASVLILSFVFILTRGSSLAWNANNRVVKANGSHVKIYTSNELVISASIDGIKAIPGSSGDPYTAIITVPEGHANKRYYPCTRSGAGRCSEVSNLTYVTNIQNIDEETGLAKSGSLSYATVPLSDQSDYYVDFVVYIAAMKKNIRDCVIWASILTERDRETFKGATTVDFYVNDLYSDTLNLANYDSSSTRFITKNEVSLGSFNIPKITPSVVPIKITLRCYFDGSLLKERGKAFITSNSIDLSMHSSLAVQFYVSGGVAYD